MSDTLETSRTAEELTPAVLNVEPANAPAFLTKTKNYFARGGSALKHRNYRLFWTGQLISLTGTWMQNLAQAWLVLNLSKNDPLALGLVGALQFLPSLLLSLFTGVIADRYPKRRLLLITQGSALFLALVLAGLTTTGLVQIWHVYVLALVLGIVNSFDMPTRQAFVSEMVGKDDLMNAVALNSTIFNAARVVGPALAGLLIGLGEKIFNSTQSGVAFAIWLNAISYIPVIINLWRIDQSKLFSPSGKDIPPGSMFVRLREGLAFIGNSTGILTLMVVVGMIGTFGFNFNVWVPVLARKYLEVGADGFGILMAALGLGAFASSITLAMGGRRPSHRRIFIAAIIFGFLEAGVALSSWYWLSLLLMIGVGISMIQVGAASNSYVQMNSPAHLRGRVMSVYLLVFAGTTPIGSLFVGWLGNVYGTPFSMVVGGLLSSASIPLIWLLLWWRRRQGAEPLKQAA